MFFFHAVLSTPMPKMSTSKPRWVHAWRESPIMLGGGELNETVLSHLGGAGGGAFQLLSFFDRWDAARFGAVCKECKDMKTNYEAFSKMKDTEWNWPAGKLQGRVTTVATAPPLTTKSHGYSTLLNGVYLNGHLIAGGPFYGGYCDGPAEFARFRMPSSIDVGKDGEVYISDTDNHTIRKLHNGIVTTIAGKPHKSGCVNGVGINVRLFFPKDLIYMNKMMYILDSGNQVIRTMDAKGFVRILCGDSRTITRVDDYGRYLPLLRAPMKDGLKGTFLRMSAMKQCKDDSLVVYEDVIFDGLLIRTIK